MSRRDKPQKPLVDRIAMLALMGLLAGVLGGLGVGLHRGSLFERRIKSLVAVKQRHSSGIIYPDSSI